MATTATILACALLLLTPTGAGLASTGASTPADTCVVRDSSGVPVVADQTQAFQQRALDKSSRLNPDEANPVAQVVMCSDGVHLKITSPNVSDGVDSEGDFTQRAAMGFSEATQYGARLMADTGAKAVSYDADRGTLTLRGEWPHGIRPQLARTRIPVTFVEGGDDRASSRSHDYSPWSPGAELKLHNSEGWMFCSAGAPVVFNGKHMLLTAGHCRSDSQGYTNGGNSVGPLFTTAWPNNAATYTDFSVINARGGMELYNGTPDDKANPDSESTLPISGGFYGQLPQNFQLCSSGRTTGQICKYIVESTNDTETVDGVRVGSLTTLSHLGNHDEGWDHGDSGGPVYYNHDGKMVIVGLVSARHDNPFGADNWRVAQLSGVRKWNSSVIIAP